MDTEKQRLRPSPLLLQIQKRKKKKKKTPPESFGCKKRSGAFHSLQNAGEKRLTRCSARDKYRTKKCASKFALIQRTKTTIKCSHADRTVFCLLLHRKTCVWFRAGESQMEFRLGQKPSVYSSTTIVRYEWRESNKRGGNYSSKSWFLLDVCSRSGWTAQMLVENKTKTSKSRNRAHECFGWHPRDRSKTF